MSVPVKTGSWKRSAQAEDYLLVLKLRDIGEWKQGSRTKVCRRCAQIREPGQGGDR